MGIISLIKEPIRLRLRKQLNGEITSQRASQTEGTWLAEDK